ncbi:sorting nexin-30-like isoform X3 [Osmia bicornis bicornis]|uniref:sorting nexin-30-like isoform X3 n=1 Tax=Osmia bicornis bicornis TaxID=1437191 RepID=UPI0010F7C368|nr:sorting nexin-30-like isoform X3 [Osmia bicornis bicornis]
MMTSSETDVEKLGENNAEDTAILEIASPSVDSFSTLPEQEISDFQADSRDLQVKVDNPQKHLETLETYITFRITTKSTRPEFDEGEYVVRRRYNDFIWLRQKLVDSYPTHIIPPMPGKHTLLAQLDRYSKEFIIARMKLLHIFLNRVVNHPILSCDKNLHIFLTSKPAEFLIHRKNRGNVLVKMTDSLQNIASTYTMKQRHFEFEQIREYCTALSEKLATIDKINHRIQKDRQDYLLELHQLHPIFTLWATSEPELAPILLAIAKAIECNAVAHQKLLENVPNEEREYISYIDAVKGALSRRDSMQIEYEMTIEDLAKKRVEKDQQLMGIVSGNLSTQNWGGSLWKAESRDEKLERLGQAIPRLAKQAELLQDRVECANENLRSDLQRWNVEKQMDLKNMLIAMADRQIRHYQQCMNAWEETLAGLKLDGTGDVNVGSSIKIPI